MFNKTAVFLQKIFFSLFFSAIILTISSPVRCREVFPEQLANGLKIISAPNVFSDMVGLEIIFKVGIGDELEQQAGERFVLQRLLTDKLESITDAEGWEGEVGGEAGMDYVELHMTCTSEGFEDAVAALSQVLLQPFFLPEQVANVKRELSFYQSRVLQDPFQENYALFRRTLYGDFPYGGKVEGSASMLDNLTPDSLRQFYGAWFAPNNAKLAVSGGVGPERARRVIAKAFGDWSPQPINRRPFPDFSFPQESRLIVAEEKGTENAHLFIGFSAPAVGKNETFAAFQVAYAVLGKMSGRINTALRDHLGLVYDSNCFFPTLEYPSHLGISLTCRPEEVEEVKGAVVEAVNQISREPISLSELAAAKAFLLGQHLVSRQRNLQQAYFLAWYETLGLGADFEEQYPVLINDVTAQEVQAVAGQYFRKMVIVLRLPE
jgi:zinc protease